MIERFIDKDNVKLAKKEIMACEKKKDELILEYNPKYEDITEQFISEIDNNKKATIKDATSVVKNNKKYYVNDKNISFMNLMKCQLENGLNHFYTKM